MEKPLIFPIYLQEKLQALACFVKPMDIWCFFIIAFIFLVAYLIRRFIDSKTGWWNQSRHDSSMLWMLIVVITVVLFLMVIPRGGRTGVIELNLIIKIVTIKFWNFRFSFLRFGIRNQISRLVFIIAWFFHVFIFLFFRLFLHNRGSLLSWGINPYCLSE